MNTMTADEVNATDYMPMAPGDYPLEIVESDYVAHGDGMMAKFECQVIGGEYDGRPYYIDLSLEHAEPEKQDVAQRDFLALRSAVGVIRPENTVELHNKPFRVTVGIATDDTGAPVNVIEATTLRMVVEAVRGASLRHLRHLRRRRSGRPCASPNAAGRARTPGAYRPTIWRGWSGTGQGIKQEWPDK